MRGADEEETAAWYAAPPLAQRNWAMHCGLHGLFGYSQDSEEDGEQHTQVEEEEQYTQVETDTVVETKHWEVLGLQPGASSREVTTAYRTLSRRHHPPTSVSLRPSFLRQPKICVGLPGRPRCHQELRQDPGRHRDSGGRGRPAFRHHARKPRCPSGHPSRERRNHTERSGGCCHRSAQESLSFVWPVRLGVITVKTS